jgi:GntR family transcriptional repressor for pyruvate dehydrogenase complex
MRQLLDIMANQAKDGGWDHEIDAQFHYAITAATHNTLQVHLLDTIHSLFHTAIQVALTEFYRKEGYTDLLLRQHNDILEAIAAHDPERARQTMMSHLTLVLDKMAEMLNR